MEKKLLKKKNLNGLNKFSSMLLKYRIIKQNEYFAVKKKQNEKAEFSIALNKTINTKVKKYQLKDQENTDIWSIAESFNILSQNPKNIVNEQPGKKVKPNLREDIFKEMLGFKLKRLNKAGARTPKELWDRVKFLSKGLTLDEWSDRVESSWENMLEYSEKLWENFFIFSFKKYGWYPYAQKLWSDSWYGQNWRNWRREEDTVTWQINSRVPWNKHVRLSNDAAMLSPPLGLMEKENRTNKSKGDYTFPQDAEKIIGPNRLKLKNQIFTNTSRHEIIKQGVYNMEHPEISTMNAWQDSANIYLKYIRPWLLRLNFMDKPVQSAFKYLGKEQHRKNYQVVSQKNIFQIELYKISYNLKLIKQLSEIEKTSNKGELERKFGKRNVKMFIQNKNKFSKLLNYEKLLHFRQTNQNLSMLSSNAVNPLNVLPPINLNKHILIVFFVIPYLIK